MHFKNDKNDSLSRQKGESFLLLNIIIIFWESLLQQ